MLLVVPPFDPEPYPSLGGQVCDFLEERAVFGPGSLKGQPCRLNSDQRLVLYRLYEHFPKGHERAGKRRFQNGAISVRKGSAKTELLAWIAFVELHPESPARFAGYARDGSLLQGRPVNDPYVPMLAATQEQVAELAYGALMTICDLGADPDYFDIGLDRIVRIGVDGEADGKAVPLAGAPDARDGARTTCNVYDETHRLYLPRARAAVQTMDANLPKRPLEDPWSVSATTAGEPGQNSVAEDDYAEAQAIARGEVARPSLFYFHRQASDGYDLDDFEQRLEAVREASGPDVAEWSDLHAIASRWDKPGVDRAFLERVWLNRWTQSGAQAFDVKRWSVLALDGERIERGARVTLGFDGARFDDATAFVITDIDTGFQQMGGLWERPEFGAADWEVPEDEVTERFREIMRTYRVQRVYCDPPHWTSTVGQWEARHPEKVFEWWTNRRREMVKAIQEYAEAIATGHLSHDGDPDLTRHLANAGRQETQLRDENGERLWILGKIHPERKFDACMAAILSWKARSDLIRKGHTMKRRRGGVARAR